MGGGSGGETGVSRRAAGAAFLLGACALLAFSLWMFPWPYRCDPGARPSEECGFVLLAWVFSGAPLLVAGGVLGIVAVVLLLSGWRRWIGIATVLLVLVGTLGVMAAYLESSG